MPTRDEIFLETPVFSTGGNAMTATGINDVNPVDAEIDANSSLVYGVFNDVDIRSEARHDELTTKFTQVSLEGKHAFSDAFNMRAQVGFAEANHDNPVQTTLLLDALNIDGYSYDYRANSRLPLITFGTTDVANPATWSLSQIRLRPQSTINSYPDRVARLRVGGLRCLLAEVRSAVEELHLQVHRSAPFQRNDGQPWNRFVRSRLRSPTTAL